MAARQEARAAATRERLEKLLDLSGEERALDVGTGAGAFALALAPLVREAVGADVVPELLAKARAVAPANARFVEADARALPFEDASFDLVCTARALHHVVHPARVVAEMTRVLRPGGTMLVVDQIAPADPAAAEALNDFERARDPSTSTVLTDAELRALLAGLELLHAELHREPRELESYLDLAGCDGAERERAQRLAPADIAAEVGWYVLRR